MSEDRTASAALAIERYVAGLRAELALLGPAEANELAGEIRAMLLDATREDPETAFSEMERLGEPSRLAASLLVERGITPEGGIPAASWMRLGTAAVIDILVGVALPIAVIVTLYNGMFQTLFSPLNSGVSPWDRLFSLAYGAALLGFSLWFAWRLWAPWRVGGRATTVGMAIAQIAVVSIGGARTVARRADLEAAGVDAPRRSGLSAVASVALAALVLGWSLSMVSAGALDATGEGAVYQLAGPASSQEGAVGAATSQFYEAAMTTIDRYRTWPPMEDARLQEAVVTRFTGVNASGGGYEIGEAVNVAPGVWTVSVSETTPGQTGPRQATLTWGLRVQWSAASQPQSAFVLLDYR